jgi:hypothetical protein
MEPEMLRSLTTTLTLLAAGAAAAGSVDVRFDHPENYADARTTLGDAASIREQLAAHLRSLGERLLPADQHLKVEVLDIDLAGEMKYSWRMASEVRVLRGRADWPRIKLRYWLESGGQQLAKGEEVVADMDYLNDSFGSVGSESLGYEKRMLERWFRARFAAKP